MKFEDFNSLPSFRQVRFTGQRVTVERTAASPTGFVVTGWEKGLPVARRPVSASVVGKMLKLYPHTLN